MASKFAENATSTVYGSIGIVDAYLTSYLWRIAKNNGDLAVVVIDSIYSKIVPVTDLVEIISSLECVSHAEVFEKQNLANAIPIPEMELSNLSRKHFVANTPHRTQVSLDGPNKCVCIEELLSLYGGMPGSREFPLIAVSGCFDVFHMGHNQLISTARKTAPNGRLLVITLSDSSITKQSKNLAGDRPIYPQDCRVHMLSSLRAVDHVLVLDSLDCISALEILGIDLFVKSIRDIDRPIVIEEACVINRRGGQTIYTEQVEKGKSTTRFLEKIRAYIQGISPKSVDV